jgi:UDP-GlcNAc:undecaprenyl-phosphate GlcNAc-1-phosphate transferase
MFLGFMLATIAIISGGKIATVLVVFGIYAVDALYVVVRRIFHGKNPLQGDFTHLHHRLLDLGLSHTQILAFVGGLSFVFGVMSLFLDKFGKILIFGVIILVVMFLNQILEKIRKIRHK